MKKIIRITLFTIILSIISIRPCLASSVTDGISQDAVIAEVSATDPVMQQAVDVPVNIVTTGYIFVGDSRLDGLVLYADFNKDPDIFTISGTSRGYKYLVNKVDKEIAKIKANNPQILKWYEIYTLGINDIGNINKYCKWYTDRAVDNNVILVSVNPLEYHKYISNEDVFKFNTNLRALNLPYIDSCDYLIKTGFSTGDGTHYNKGTCKNIALFLKSSVRSLEN